MIYLSKSPFDLLKANLCQSFLENKKCFPIKQKINKMRKFQVAFIYKISGSHRKCCSLFGFSKMFLGKMDFESCLCSNVATMVKCEFFMQKR